MWDEHPHLSIAARGQTQGGADTAARLGPAIGYTDPVAGLIVKAVRNALDQLTDAERSGDGTDVGVLVVSDVGTLHTMRQLAKAASSGRISPARFTGATPASLAGLVCIVFGFRGPSLVITDKPDAVRRTAAVLSHSWLLSGCRYVLLCEHDATAADDHIVHATVVRRSAGS